MDSLDEIDEWGKALVARGATVLHCEQLVVGKVVRYYDGQSERSNGCNCPVLELEKGHTFVVGTTKKFVELAPEEVAFFGALTNLVGYALRIATLQAKPRNIEIERFGQLVTAALRMQLAVLSGRGKRP